jgi:hypothetical protein
MSLKTKKNAAPPALILLSCSVFLLINGALAANPPANADELVSRHLDSIASPAIRAGLKTRVAQGPVHYAILVGGAGFLDGKAQMVSDGNKMQLMMKLPNNLYRGEQFIFDGEKDKVAFSTAAQSRSALGSFVFVYDPIIREGLIGGVLTTGWPLLNLDERKAKVTFEGLKKIDGQELYDLRYRPHKGTDLDINLYFDPETYRHVETVYTLTSSENFANYGPSTAVGNGPTSPGNGPGGVGVGSTQTGGTPELAAARQYMNRYRLSEKFSDFKTADGVTLPTHYDIQFTQELQNGRTSLTEWDLKGLDISNNVGLESRNFDVK